MSMVKAELWLTNTAFPTTSYDEDEKSSQYGITGCGPYDEKGLTTTYSDGVTLNNGTVGNESPEACSSTVNERSYNGLIGRLSSSTNNLYGIYDMAGGTFEYAIGSYSDDVDRISDGQFWRCGYAGEIVRFIFLEPTIQAPVVVTWVCA